MRNYKAQHFLGNNRGQEIIQDDPLIMKAHLSLHSGERPVRVVRRNLVMESVKYPLELRDDHILVIAGVADNRAPFQPVSLR